jgi:hypothetical protein
MVLDKKMPVKILMEGETDKNEGQNLLGEKSPLQFSVFFSFYHPIPSFLHRTQM